MARNLEPFNHLGFAKSLGQLFAVPVLIGAILVFFWPWILLYLLLPFYIFIFLLFTLMSRSARRQICFQMETIEKDAGADVAEYIYRYPLRFLWPMATLFTKSWLGASQLVLWLSAVALLFKALWIHAAVAFAVGYVAGFLVGLMTHFDHEVESSVAAATYWDMREAGA